MLTQRESPSHAGRSRLLKLLYLTYIIVLFLIGAALANDGTADEESTGKCEFDRSSMLALDFEAFDQDFNGGWRKIAKDPDCVLIAADLIRDYMNHHQSNEKTIVFHEGQMRAKAGQTDRAIELIRSTREPEGENRYFGWNQYIDATTAFLEKDKRRLIDARNELAALPKPSNFSAVDRNGNPIELEWPPNMGVVDGFIECFDETYEFAYDKCSGLQSGGYVDDR